MNSLGIYFGPKVISIVETKGRRLINSALIPQSTISTGELEEKVPIEVKSTSIISLIKDELDKNKISISISESSKLTLLFNIFTLFTVLLSAPFK